MDLNAYYDIIFYCYCIALIVQSILTITFVALEEKYIYGTVRLSLFFPYFHVEKMHWTSFSCLGFMMAVIKTV